jgi:hypothetical protein
MSFAPGAIAGVGYDLGRLTLGGEVQVDWMLKKVDQDSRSSGLAQLLFGAGWRF